MVILSACNTTKNAADAGDGTADGAVAAADAKGVAAKGSAAGSGKYVDPMVSTGSRQASKRVPAGGQAGPTGLPEETMPGQASPSISGLATQPTGVRAGSFSLFSSPTAPAPAPTQMSDGPAAPAADATGSAPAGRVNAATTSLFSPRPAQVPAN
jgi:hypothetical protein